MHQAPDGSHRGKVGGLWDEIGQLQFDFLVRQGLQPHHSLLDVGCGSLRGGVHFIRYLEPGHYVGIDRDAALLAAGRDVELDAATLGAKQPLLVEMRDFQFGTLGRAYDYALAQSVFTHLPLNQIMRCLVNMGQVLNPDGRFFATFFENPHGRAHVEPINRPNQVGRAITTFYDADPFHYTFETMAWASEGTGLRAEHLGDWQHPRGQRMLMFHRDH